MSLNDYKITELDYKDKDVASLPDEPSEEGISAADLKAAFDRLTKEVVVPKYNAFVETSAGADGAGNIGAAEIESGAGTTVQSNLEYLLGKLNVHLAAPIHLAYSSEIPMPAQPEGGIWVQEMTETPQSGAAVIKNATVSQGEISNRENLWLDT
ncbi:hypothetical protein [Christensenella tenuis]|jgi:hypothetical protein|uniref:Uncharacterized protein n=1 Tax=Christensenella tenuis TaxID=2763033 RepID=A0ABR7EEP2_9FIRM|nr:hypothetical protein [Christensenella tenuis]MBC5648252.1 hypothetical protein [Christensenella tenuis]